MSKKLLKPISVEALTSKQEGTVRNTAAIKHEDVQCDDFELLNVVRDDLSLLNYHLNGYYDNGF